MPLTNSGKTRQGSSSSKHQFARNKKTLKSPVKNKNKIASFSTNLQVKLGRQTHLHSLATPGPTQRLISNSRSCEEVASSDLNLGISRDFGDEFWVLFTAWIGGQNQVFVVATTEKSFSRFSSLHRREKLEMACLPLTRCPTEQ